MKPDIVREIEEKTGKTLTRLTGLENLADGIRNQYNFSYVLEEGELVLLNACGTDALAELSFCPAECATLTWLNCSDNSSLARIDFAAPLPRLRQLDLSGCNLSELTLPAGCERLEKAWLRQSGVRRMTFQGPCPRLQLLDLGKNRLAELILPPGFSSLAHLYLAENRLERLVLEQEDPGDPAQDRHSPLPALETLHLGGNRLVRVPENIVCSSRLTALYLGGNRPRNIPWIFLGTHGSGFLETTDNCLEKARIWFTDLGEHPGEENRAVKLMLLGNSNVGKTTLACSMRHGHCGHDHPTTHGILLDTLERDGITYNIWDFGGQEVYHGTHRLFIASPALQVIVFDRETEEHARQCRLVPDRCRPDAEQTRPQPIQYWYETAKKLSPDSRFFLVRNNKGEQVEEDRETWEYGRNRARFVVLNARSGEDVDDLLYFLRKEAAKLPDFGMTMPRSWLRVRQFFIDNLQAESPRKLIGMEEFVRLCRQHRVMEEAMGLLLDYLHHNGYLYYHKEKLGDTIIADQRWALEAIYKPYDRTPRHYQEFRDLEGKIRVYRLFDVFGDGYAEEEKWLFLEFMASCGLCFLLNDNPGRAEKKLSDIYVFPEFLPADRPEEVTRFWETRAREVVVFRYRLKWINYFVIQSFITALGRKTETENIWRSGIHVATADGWFRVELDEEQKALFLHIEQSAAPGWIDSILEELDLDHSGQGWEISLDGAPFQPYGREQKEQLARREQQPAREGQQEKKKVSERVDDVEQELDRPVILFLAANPSGDRLNMRNEHSEIAETLADRTLPVRFELIPRFGPDAGDMIDEIDAYSPTVVHFCGHGRSTDPETEQAGGLLFFDDAGQGAKVADAETLEKIFGRIRQANPNLQLVVLNACYSEPQARAVSRNGIYAMGADDLLASKAARHFAAGFYWKYARSGNIREAAFHAVTHGLREDPDFDKHIHLFYQGEEVTP